MRGPLTWAGAHRYHHKHSDTEQDLHSPARRGFLWSHLLWFMSKEYEQTQVFDVKDLAVYPELVWINRFYFVPAYALGAALWALGGWPAFAWGFLVSTVVTWHGVFTINSLSHVFGSRPHATGDESRNNPVLAIITLGEGWHNNHHSCMQSARQGFRWWQVDPTWYVLRVLEVLGVVWELYPAPRESG
jgi:stearoyl-CoA desaturase (delta-9 desaturase)